MKTIQRRNFLKLSSLASLYAMLGIDKAQAGAIEEQKSYDEIDDYKAIVVYYKGGGNDGLNMFIPSSSKEGTGYPTYEKMRTNIRVENNELTLPVDDSGNLDLTLGNPYTTGDKRLDRAYLKGFYRHKDNDGNDLGYATNAVMPEIAHLVNQGKVAIVANCGNLIMPGTKEEFLSEKKPLPGFLYAHNYQTKLAFNGEASEQDYSGWAGRVFDYWKTINGDSVYGVNIAMGSPTHLFDGDETAPVIYNSSGPQNYKFENDTRLQMHKDYIALERREMFHNLYNGMRNRSFKMAQKMVNDWNANHDTFKDITNAYGDSLFTYPQDKLDQIKPIMAGKQTHTMETVAKLIKIGRDDGLKRQIFYVPDGGYDSHNDQSAQHSSRLRGLSLAFHDFYLAMKSLGLEEKVTIITISDFGRSTGDNGDGTDHAWGGSYFAMGGAVKGGLYGTLPDLTLEGKDDLGYKGRLIPTTSFTQYYATVLKWFGIGDEALHQILPELKNFSVKDLGFMG